MYISIYKDKSINKCIYIIVAIISSNNLMSFLAFWDFKIHMIKYKNMYDKKFKTIVLRGSVNSIPNNNQIAQKQ